MSSVDLLYIFKNPLHPTALGEDTFIGEETSFETISNLVLQYNLDKDTFKRMLTLFPNIKEHVIAQYLDFFGRSNKTDLSDAFIKLNEAIEYRSSTPLIYYDSLKEVENEKFFYYKGKALDDSCVAFFSLENHNPKQCSSLDKYIHFLLYSIEKKAEQSGNYLTTLVIDRSKTSLHNQNVELVKKIFFTITLLYPGSTLNILVYPGTVGTRFLFTFLKPFFHENLRQVITFLDSTKEFEKYIRRPDDV